MTTINNLPDQPSPQGTDVVPIARPAGTNYKVVLSLIGALAAAGSIGWAALANTSGANKLLGRGDSGAGAVQEISLGSGLAMTGTTLSATAAYTDEQAQDAVGAMVNASLTYTDATPLLTLADRDYTDFTCATGGTVCNIDANAVTFAEMQDVSAGVVLGRAAGSGTGDVQAIGVNASDFLTSPTLSFAPNGVGNGALRDSGALSVIGRSANSTGDPADISTTSGSFGVLRENGSGTIGFGTIGGAAITNGSLGAGELAGGAVSDANLRDSGALSVIGRATNSTGDPADISCSAGGNGVLRESGSTLGCGSITSESVSDLAGSTWTPTLTSVANVSSTTAYQCQYLRVASAVTASCKIDVTCTSSETLTQVGISLPVSSNFGAAEDCAGVAQGPQGTLGGPILGDATNNRCELQYSFSNCSAASFYLTFTYQII